MKLKKSEFLDEIKILLNNLLSWRQFLIDCRLKNKRRNNTRNKTTYKKIYNWSFEHHLLATNHFYDDFMTEAAGHNRPPGRTLNRRMFHGYLVSPTRCGVCGRRQYGGAFSWWGFSLHVWLSVLLLQLSAHSGKVSLASVFVTPEMKPVVREPGF